MVVARSAPIWRNYEELMGKEGHQRPKNNGEVVAWELSLAYTKIIILRDIQEHFTNWIEVTELAISTM